MLIKLTHRNFSKSSNYTTHLNWSVFKGVEILGVQVFLRGGILDYSESLNFE